MKQSNGCLHQWDRSGIFTINWTGRSLPTTPLPFLTSRQKTKMKFTMPMKHKSSILSSTAYHGFMECSRTILDISLKLYYCILVHILRNIWDESSHLVASCTM
ncbi:hypothetical protein Cni_G05002 [Canna indica]|uniref:Uncharacterized protein n=1 Tax=Canna indica TaxID=4628 RepID=A0AAQ3Q4I1_9LILI|nr:hypothetical protein Cni_G05002 [Canna indica]